MTSFNLGVCVSPSMLWPPPSVKAETAENAKSTAPQFVEFVIDHFPEIFGNDAVGVLGDKSEIVVDTPTINGSGDSESYDDSRGRSVSLHHSDINLFRGENYKYDSGQSGTLLTVKDNWITQSRSTPNSPVLQRKKMGKNLDPNDISRKIHTAFYHPKHSPRQSRRTSDQSPLNHEAVDGGPRDTVPARKKPIKLTSTTTSAELIEHKPDVDDKAKKRSSSSNTMRSRTGPEPAVLKTTAVLKREGMLHLASSQSFYTAPAHIAERVHCVDRRRQPAAPSYQEHMQRRANQPTLKIHIPCSSPETADRDEVPSGSKSTETKIGLALSPASVQMRNALTAGRYMFTHCSPASSLVSPASSERSVPSKLSTGSETSISSLSSNDENMDTDTSAFGEDKPDITRLKHIRDLLDVSGYANPLRISPETFDEIVRTQGEWGSSMGEECPEMDDFQRMTMAEETYV